MSDKDYLKNRESLFSPTKKSSKPQTGSNDIALGENATVIMVSSILGGSGSEYIKLRNPNNGGVNMIILSPNGKMGMTIGDEAHFFIGMEIYVVSPEQKPKYPNKNGRVIVGSGNGVSDLDAKDYGTKYTVSEYKVKYSHLIVQ